uniref:Geranylgeranyl pyrophosphate synthase n=2 Tax=Melopsittacus undulatus TaxID=13146 RepID=A0A8V5H1B5_MELUD
MGHAVPSQRLVPDREGRHRRVDYASQSAPRAAATRGRGSGRMLMSRGGQAGACAVLRWWRIFPQQGKVAPGGAEGGGTLAAATRGAGTARGSGSGWRRRLGKQVRTKLSQAFNHWLNVPEDKIQVIIEVTEMLHNASLLVDDIEDNSKLRRGFPVAHSIYGIPSVINCANYVYFLGLEKVLTLDHPDAVKVFTRQLLELHKGQGLDIYWRDTYTCPTEAEYKAMVLQKTGGLFGLAVGLMQLFSNYKEDLKPLLNTLGLFFQIRDDYANLHSKEYSENKSFCEDLTEGKFSFPTIHAIWSRPESTQVQNILRQRTENIDIKKYCVHYLENVGSFEYTRNTLKELESEAYKQIESLGGNPELVALVEQLSKMFKESEN